MKDSQQRLSGAARRVAASGPRRRSDERGSTLVEFSISVVLLLTLLFGIITFGYMLSFKQGMTQATAEGARAAAVVSSGSAVPAAEVAAANSVDAFGKSCAGGDGDGLDCTFVLAACASAPASECITVQMTYDYDQYPLLPEIPLLGALLPDTLTSRSVAMVGS